MDGFIYLLTFFYYYRHESPVEVACQARFRWLDDLVSAAEGFFCVDRKADPANWQYKSLYRGDIAR